MAIHRSTPESRALSRTLKDELPQRTRVWGVKLAGSMALALLFLVLSSQIMLSARLERASAREQGYIVQLTAETPAEALKEPLLRLYPPGGDQTLAASALAAWLHRTITPDSSLESLSRLKEVQILATEVASHADSQEYARALVQARETARQKQLPAPESISAFSMRQLQLLRPALAIRTPEAVRSAVRWSTLWMVLGALFPIGIWSWRRLRPDPWLLSIAVGLSSLGFTLMIGLRDPLREALLFPDFAQGVLVGGLLFGLASLVDWQASVASRLSWVPLLGALGLSLVLLTLGSGPGLSDAKVNLSLGPLVIQPVEAVKLLVLLFLAGWCARRWEFLRSLHVRSEVLPGVVRRLGVPRPRDVLPVALGVGLSLGFLFLQKDMGPALVLAWTFLGMYSLARARVGLASLGLIVLVLGCYAAWWFQNPGTVYRRVEMLLHPWDSLLPGADQLALGLWAVASGGATGAGLGWGETARVPAAHTDFILAGVAEELGVLGLAFVLALYGILVARLIRMAGRQEVPWSIFFVAGTGFMLLAQLGLIGGGVLGMLPLSGVTTPLLSYGKSSQLAVFTLLGMCAGISAYDQKHLETRLAAEVQASSSTPRPFAGGLRVSLLGLTVTLLALLARAGWLGLVMPEAIMVHPLLALQAGDEVGFVPNPRLRAIAEEIPRGTLLDRNGLPLATVERGLLDAHAKALKKLGADPDLACPDRTRRCYPFGGLTFALLGDVREQVNWAASNTSFAEKVYSQRLQGYDDGAEVVRVKTPAGTESVELRRSYQALLPLWWTHRDRSSAAWRGLLEKDRDVRLTLDMVLQVALENALKSALEHVRQDRKIESLTQAAGVILDVQTGALLAAVSLPSPARLGTALRSLNPNAPELFDRARFAIYPPGSTFKLVTAMAALRKDPELEHTRYTCIRLPDGRAGAFLPGKKRPIRDDIKDQPHGSVALERGIQYSCNAYFAQLATDAVKAEALFETASLFGIKTAEPNTPEALQKSLDQVGFGQGTVVMTPLQVAEVAATIASGGRLIEATLLEEEAALREREQKESASSAEHRGAGAEMPRHGERVLRQEHARTLAEAMRMVVTGGTARSALGQLEIPVAGKTGTAEVEGDKGSHAWFMGFAPFLEQGQAPVKGIERPLAFAIMLENAGYGGRYAAPVVGQVLQAVLEAKGIGAEPTKPEAEATQAGTPKGEAKPLRTSKTVKPKSVQPPVLPKGKRTPAP